MKLKDKKFKYVLFTSDVQNIGHRSVESKQIIKEKLKDIPKH